jgi:hypothetical protein
MDSFMASLIRDESDDRPKPRLEKPLPQAAPQSQTQRSAGPLRTAKTDAPKQREPQKEMATAPSSDRSSASHGSGTKKIILSIVVLLLIASGTVLGLQKLSPGLFGPRNPFTEEVKDRMGVPLYYPTKLPGSYKIETGSVTQPESDVVLYSITDDDGKRINMTLQKKPDGINLDPLYSALVDVEEFDTVFGKVKTGLSDNVQITNILTDATWIIINSPKGTLDKTQLTSLVNSLRT